MRSQLDPQGLIPPPSSYTWACLRVAALEREVNQINEQLDDPVRAQRDIKAYFVWCDAAREARGRFLREEAQLRAWLGRQQALGGNGLFRQAFDLLKRLEVEIDFEPEEHVLLEQLTTFFNSQR